MNMLRSATKRFVLFMATLVMIGASLAPALPAFAEGNLIANPSVETITNNQPANWHGDHWGTNQATLTVANTGANGSKSLRIDVSQYTDGDAKWMADAVTVTPNASYTYTSQYKASADTEIDLQYTHADGSVSYEYIQWLPAAADWQPLSATFTTPATAAKVTVLHIIAQNGWLQTDDFALAPTVVPPHEDDNDNLIANGSFETVNGALPAAWNTNTWGGTVAQFAHANTGRTGNRSATIQVTNAAQGDGKWYAQPVTVQAGKSYVYRDYYKSTVDSRVVAAYINAAGAYNYIELDAAPTSPTDWRQYQATLTVPAGITKATIFHLLDKTGTLTLDDVLLQAATTAPSGPAVPNASLETALAGQPASWQHNNWGSNQAAFSYENTGHSGSKSVKVTVNNYVDGDAKWYFNPITGMVPGQQYRLSAWYKTNAQPRAVVMYQLADGTEGYIGMPSPQPAADSATNWQLYSDVFTVPAGAISISAFLLIEQNGWLQTDDYGFSDYHPNGFSRALLSLTFDDGHEDNVNTALPLLNQYGFKSTQFFATTFIEGNAQAVANIKAFQQSGHEIGSHTVTHPFLTQVNAATLQYELQHSQQYLQSILGTPVVNFASPYGDYDTTVNNAIKQYYGSHRTVDEGYNSRDNFDPYRLRVQNILDTTTPDQVRQWIAQAQSDKTWLILVYHRIANDPGPYDAYTDVFAQQLQVVRDSGITVKTYGDALTEVRGQVSQ